VSTLAWSLEGAIMLFRIDYNFDAGELQAIVWIEQLQDWVWFVSRQNYNDLYRFCEVAGLSFDGLTDDAVDFFSSVEGRMAYGAAPA